MQKTPKSNKPIAENTFRRNKKYFPQGFVTAFALAACGKESTKETAPVIEIETVEPVVSPTDILTPNLVAGVNYSSPSNNNRCKHSGCRRNKYQYRSKYRRHSKNIWF